MASVDKTSVRNEVGRLKADFEQLCTEGNITHEVKILMNSMFMIIELMLSIFLSFITHICFSLLENYLRRTILAKTHLWS